MTANIAGARLREVERELARIRGEDAVNTYLDEHPNEVTVLQQLVEWRRAGRVVPALARVQRAMLWSDGTLELRTVSTEPSIEPRAQQGRRGPGPGGSGPGRDRGRRQGGDQGRNGNAPQFRTTGAAGGIAGRQGDGAARRSGPNGTFRGVIGKESPQASGAPRTGRPGARRRTWGEEDTGLRGVPRSGEGWVLLREGEVPPPETAPEDDDVGGDAFMAQEAPSDDAPAQVAAEHVAAAEVPELAEAARENGQTEKVPADLSR
ncbi:MAG: hypothetical protein HY332_01670 [Chloroflexi bacterium]|nr:hypothetical protein [Chloroflexota bacterium]